MTSKSNQTRATLIKQNVELSGQLTALLGKLAELEAKSQATDTLLEQAKELTKLVRELGMEHKDTGTRRARDDRCRFKLHRKDVPEDILQQAHVQEALDNLKQVTRRMKTIKKSYDTTHKKRSKKGLSAEEKSKWDAEFKVQWDMYNAVSREAMQARLAFDRIVDALLPNNSKKSNKRKRVADDAGVAAEEGEEEVQKSKRAKLARNGDESDSDDATFVQS